MAAEERLQDRDERSLSAPSKELAEKILRKVSWQERLEGSIYDPGPGAIPERIFKLEEVYNLLRSLPNFSVDLRQLERWVREVLGDEEAAAEIKLLLDGKEEEEAREGVTRLLGQRIEQCKEILAEAERSNAPVC